MILECVCGKMYRIKDDAPNRPSKCPACGGALKIAGGGPPGPAPARVQELETRIKDLERELDEARSAPPPRTDAPPAGVIDSTLQAQLDQLRASSDRADELQRKLFDVQSQQERDSKEKDRQLAQAREALERESAERRKLEAQVKGVEEKSARTLVEKQKTIEALDASVADYRSKLEALQTRVDAAEMQRMSDQSGFETRLRDREQEVRAEYQKIEENHRKALSELRTRLEEQIAEKDRQISEGRQSLDREAGERRRLSEVLSRLQENADRTLAEKKKAIEALEANIASGKSKAEILQKRVDALEQLRRHEQDALIARIRTHEGAVGRVQEASHLATDLDHSLDGMSTVLSTLRDRVRRLKDRLDMPPSDAPPLATASFASFAPSASPLPAIPAAAEEAPVALSQTAGFDALIPVAAAKVEEKAKEEERPVLAAAPREGVVRPPTVEMKREPEPEREAEAPPEPAAEATASAEDPDDAVPLISPAEDEAPKAAAPPAKAAEPDTKKKSFVSRFSWKKK